MEEVIDLMIMKGNGHDEVACNPFYLTVGILQCSLESAALIVGIESAVLIGVLSLQASVKFRLVFWNLSGLCGVILSLCAVFAESLPKSLRSLAVFSECPELR